MKAVLFALLCAMLFLGCSTFTDITYKTLDVTENSVGTKIGQIDQTQGGILEAAKNAGITRISTVSKQRTDTYTTYYWPLVFAWAGGRSYTTLTGRLEEIIVTGE
jgi:hypothetical protein